MHAIFEAFQKLENNINYGTAIEIHESLALLRFRILEYAQLVYPKEYPKGDK